MDIKQVLNNQGIKKYAIVIAILALVVFVGGRMSGYLIAENTYGTELANLTEKYGALNDSYNSCLSDVSGMINSITSLETEKANLTSSLSSANSNLAGCSSDLLSAKSAITSKDASIAALESEKNIISQNYSSLASNTAKSLCCVKKIFDPSLAAYYVENNTIVCTSDTSKTLFAC